MTSNRSKKKWKKNTEIHAKCHLNLFTAGFTHRYLTYHKLFLINLAHSQMNNKIVDQVDKCVDAAILIPIVEIFIEHNKLTSLIWQKHLTV